MTNAKELLKSHLLEYAVRRGDFTLKSGAKSTYFMDVKKTAANPDAMLLVAQCMLDAMPDDIDAIGGLTMGADPVAFITAAVAATQGRKISAFSIRKEVKDHGAGGRIAGVLNPGDRVVITEDCVTRGTSPLEAAMAVREFGAVPVLILALVDRGGSCAKLAADQGIDFAAVLTAPDLGLPYEGGL